MIPIVTPEEMAAIDAAAPEPVEVLIGRAGAAVAHAVVTMLGGTYGRRVVVLAGLGNNGADGRDAARRLERRGVRVQIHDLGALPERIDHGDLVIDAVLGTGARPGFVGPEVEPSIPVLAVDLPSGLDGLTGAAGEGVLRAERTVCFAALKPGLVLEPGRSLAGQIEVVDIGLDTSTARAWVMTDDDLRVTLPHRAVTAHKWRTAVWVIAGSPGMTGAAHLAVRGAQRSGAGYVRLSSPGVPVDPLRPTESVGVPLAAEGWSGEVLDDLHRFRAVVIGPGLGRDPSVLSEAARLIAEAPVPVLIDGDGLAALGSDPGAILRDRGVPTVLTPHDAEFEALTGALPGPDRFAAARDLAANSGAIVLLKGPTTLIANPDGRVLVVTKGDSRLATAGTGDVLAGVIGGLIGSGVDPFRAAAGGAHLHALAGVVGSGHGLVAGDLADRIPLVFDDLFED
jgi:ADP-dependent NAD(P)H-hydrate dehydratase / NAD(P)H-hydrate epimerase